MKKTNQVAENRLFYKGHELFIARLKDLFDTSLFRYKPVQTSFLSMVELQLLHQHIPKSLFVYESGGYPYAQRKVVAFSPFELEPDFNIAILESSYDSRTKHLSHKDVLGALMHLGIERNQLGDLYVDDSRIVIFTTQTMKEYIIDSCHLIGRCKVSFRPVDSVDIQTQGFEVIQVHTSSLRLDAIVSALAHCSRKNALDMIHHGYVKLNDVVLEENQQVCNNDFVSIRKTGRFQFVEIQSVTKKERLVLKFNKFI